MNEFMNRLIKLEGYKDKTHGINVSLMQAMHEAMVTLRVWETNDYPNNQQQVGELLDEMIRVIGYWKYFYKINNASSTVEKSWWQLRRKMRW